jgi:hypothetical protein
MVEWEAVLAEDHPRPSPRRIIVIDLMILVQAAIVKHQLRRRIVGLVLFVIAIKKRVKVALIAVAIVVVEENYF